MLRYYRKFLAGAHSAPLKLLVTAGIWLRFSALAVLLTARRMLRRP